MLNVKNIGIKALALLHLRHERKVVSFLQNEINETIFIYTSVAINKTTKTPVFILFLRHDVKGIVIYSLKMKIRRKHSKIYHIDKTN